MAAPGPNRPLIRLIAWSLIWLVLSNLAAEVSGVYSWQPYTHPVETAKLTTVWADYPDCDLLLLGSSLVLNAFAPQIIESEVQTRTGEEICAYNAGVQALTLGSSVSWLRSILSRAQPRVLLFGTTAQECMFDADQRFYRGFAAPSDLVRQAVSGSVSMKDAGHIASASFRAMGLLPQWMALAATQSARYVLGLAPTRLEDEMSLDRRYAGWRPLRSDNGQYRTDWPWEKRPSWSSLSRLFQTARSRGVTVVVLLMPLGRVEDPREAEKRRLFAPELKAFCAANGIQYVDLGEAPYRPHDDSYVEDGRHLMVEGARKLSRQLARQVVAPLLVSNPEMEKGLINE